MGGCIVYRCPSRSGRKTLNQQKYEALKGRKISFHRFPANKKLCKEWINACRRDKWKPDKYSRICSVHFEDSCYASFPFGRLLENAIPTLFPTFPAHLQKTAKTRKPPKQREFNPQAATSVNANVPANENRFLQGPGNIFLINGNLSNARTVANMVYTKPTFQVPFLTEFSSSNLKSSSECDENGEEPLESDFDPSDYVYPVDEEVMTPYCTLEDATGTASPSCAAESSLENSCEDDLQESFEISANHDNGFLTTDFSEIEISNECSKSCNNCELQSQANVWLLNTLKDKETRIKLLTKEITYLRSEVNLRSKKLTSLHEKFRQQEKICNCKPNE